MGKCWSGFIGWAHTNKMKRFELVKCFFEFLFIKTTYTSQTSIWTAYNCNMNKIVSFVGQIINARGKLHYTITFHEKQ